MLATPTATGNASSASLTYLIPGQLTEQDVGNRD
ncbi:Uncharacterised protein [Mycobacteroides abscessus]|nr:Uncharacterised protein [Mycobacteroides abscessus]CPX45140.1 Uncharacterised protein [Mycobacteroides abscessus]CPZ60281.1 Uncharacterised protein [Mycobacteroides abscessus]SLH90466.1 Uncharacterised protein [Mycobacteroides abscessus subsp. massiliense]SLI32426.1 Uncharacterised protein [Mycobacteroides abscessus subsp. massiliense]